MPVELLVDSIAVGGDAVAREPSGRVVFVAGALPGERVLVDLHDERSRFAKGHVVQVLDASPDRVDAPCPHLRAGCGGCDWQHVAPEAQRALRLGLVRDVLTRQGLDPTVLRCADPLPGAVRTTVRGTAGASGRFAFRRRRSHDPIEVDSCIVSHPALQELLVDGYFADARDVTVRAGARTGERLVLVGPTAKGVQVPPDVLVVGTDELRSGRRAWYHEEAAGRTWRISAQSFFQASAEGTEALVGIVGAAVAEHAPSAETMVDLCAGVGLFAGTVGAGRRVVAVERSASSVADARHNLADVDARVLKVAMERWRPSPAEVVVADPARSGLGAGVVDSVAATGARLCVLVSCDPASLGRDGAALAGHGFELVSATVLDLFEHTSHVEVVSTFVRSGSDPVR